MRARCLWLLAFVGVAAFASANALGAGRDRESPHKRKMEKMIQDADELRSKGEALKAHKMYLDAANINVDKDLVKLAKECAAELEEEAKETLDRTKELSKEKEPEQSDVTETLCDCFKVQMAWPRHVYGAEARKRFKKLKRKLSKDTKKEAEKAAKEMVGEGKKHLKANDLRSALASYEQLYTDYAFTKQASKALGLYMKLKAMVAELDRKEEEERKREER